MSRPVKCRRVCCLPRNDGFNPLCGGSEESAVILAVDEYEAIRLIDKEGFSQEQCGSYMKIARATVQQIYTSARKKLAEALVDGLPLRIAGGHYCLCDGNESYCGCGGCRRHRQRCMEEKRSETNMKIAIPLDENKTDVCIVLSRAPYFLFEEDGTEEILANPAAQAESGAGLKAAQFLVDQGTTALVTVRCGENAAKVFRAADIEIFASVGTDARANLAACREGKLSALTHFHGGFHGIS